jgi:hypothetical protein
MKLATLARSQLSSDSILQTCKMKMDGVATDARYPRRSLSELPCRPPRRPNRSCDQGNKMECVSSLTATMHNAGLRGGFRAVKESLAVQ